MRRVCPLLAAVLGIMLPSCGFKGLFKSNGAPCVADDNCPDAQVCCAGRCVDQCGTGSLAVSVTLSTDFVPYYEFDTATVALGSELRTVPVSAVTELVVPRTVAQFAEVAPGQHQVIVKLLAGVNVVASRTVTFTMSADATVPVIVTRDCIGVVCDGDAQCLSGRCVSSRCSALDESACPPPACASDGDCSASSTCARGVCIGGRCLERREEALCAPDERCIPGRGCVVQTHECDVALECDDLTSCTLELCINGRCTAERDDTRCGVAICDPAAKRSDPSTGCTPEPCSPDNCVPAPCETASCVDGACVRQSVCDSGQRCCEGVCALNCNDPRACAGRPLGYVCRVATGACDLAETCDGVTDSCPPDSYVLGGTVCRAVAGPCDVQEACDGRSVSCPVNAVAALGSVCRASAGACDLAEACNGVSAACPADAFVTQGTECRPSAGVCDVAESCTGSGPGCPGNVFVGSSTTCRASAGVCDVAEKCTGSSAACPANGFASSSVVCRGSAGVCDAAENCTGSIATCPADVSAANGTYCADGGTCLYYACNNGSCNTGVARNDGAACDSGSCAVCAGGGCAYANCQQYSGEYCGTPGGGASGCVGLVALNRWVAGADHWVTTDSVSGYSFEGSMGSIFTASASGAQALYGCLVGGWDHMLSLASDCEGTTFLRTEGWIYATPHANTSALYRCYTSAGDHFASHDGNCEGQGVESILGYTLP